MDSCRPTPANAALARCGRCSAQTAAENKELNYAGALTGELKTGPRAGNKTLGALQECRALEHRQHTTLSLPNRTATSSELSPASMKQGSVQVAGTEDPYAQTCEVRDCSYRTVHDTVGGVVYGFFIPWATDPYALHGNKEEY